VCFARPYTPHNKEKAKVKRALVVAIVDDDNAVRMATRGLVESFGYDVETFDSAEAFLGSEWSRKAHCLITDVQMPGMSGFDLHKHLVSSDIDMPVIFITAFPDSALRDRVLKGGAVAYLTKPFDQAVLLESIRRAIGDD
jgi:FixJ family two-component response regulator